MYKSYTLACLTDDMYMQLVSRGCQPDTQDSEGQAPLHLAVLSNQVGCVQSLAQSGADMNIQDSNRDSPLHVSEKIISEAFLVSMYYCIDGSILW